jgi:hypothetical protein
MAVKLAIMKSGEQIIADIKEMESDGKVLGYYFYKACIVHMMNPNEPNPSNKNERRPKKKIDKTAFDISLFPWIPMAKGYEIPIVSDWVMTFVDPVDMLYEMYEENVLNASKEWNEGMNRKEDTDEGCKTCR